MQTVQDAAAQPWQELMQVDDDPHHCIFVERARRQLQLPGRVLSMHDGDQAMARLADATRPRPELLLLDWKMPGRDGSEVLRWVRAQAHLAEMAVVIVSGSDFADHKRHATELGANEYFAKPRAFDEYASLAKRIEEFRAGRRLQDRWRDPVATLTGPCLSAQPAAVGSSSMNPLSPSIAYPLPAQFATQLEAFSGATGLAGVVRDFMGAIVQTVAQVIPQDQTELAAVCRKYKIEVGMACRGRCPDYGVIDKRRKVLLELMALDWDDTMIFKWFIIDKRTLQRLRAGK